jgi:hypothetical protein
MGEQKKSYVNKNNPQWIKYAQMRYFCWALICIGRKNLYTVKFFFKIQKKDHSSNWKMARIFYGVL